MTWRTSRRSAPLALSTYLGKCYITLCSVSGLCCNQLKLPSVNKGTGNPSNKNRIQHTIVDALASGLLSMDDLANQNISNRPVTYQSHNLPPPQLLSEPSATPSLSSTKSAAAVHCATATCVTKGGTRTKGSVQCSGMQCISCCRSFVESQILAGLPHRVCAYNKHRLAAAVAQALFAQRLATGVQRTGAAALLTQPHDHAVNDKLPTADSIPIENHDVTGSSRGSPPTSARASTPSESRIREQSLIIPTSATTSSSNVLLTAPSANHAAPLSTMWQNVGPEWLHQHRLASAKQDLVTSKTQRSSELATKVQVKIMYWPKANVPSVTFPVVVEDFPNFSLSDYPAIAESFGLLTDEVYLEAYETGWEHHTRATSRKVAKNDVLLYQALPGGLQGSRLSNSDCPGIEAHIRKRGPVPGKGKGRSDNNRPLSSEPVTLKRARSPDENVTHNDQTQFSEPLPKRRCTINLTLDSDSDDDFPSTISHLVPKVEEPLAGPEFLQGSSRMASVPQLKKKRRPWKGDVIKIWPTSYSAAYILTGFKAMDLLLAQCTKGKLLIPDAFSTVFKGTLFVQLTFSLHWGVYGRAKTLGKDLIKEFKSLRNSEEGGWPEFVAAFRAIELGKLVMISSPGPSFRSVKDEEMLDVVMKPKHSVVVGDDGDSSDSDDGFVALDPCLLCPFCDEVYPPQPSQCLCDQCTELEKISTPAPNMAITRNENHLQVFPATATAKHCERHRFESVVAAQASHEHWPTDIDFNHLVSHIQSLCPILLHIIDNPDSNSYFQKLEEGIKEDGSARTFYLEGEYGAMRNIGVGYYGPKGYQIMYLLLLKAFPALEIDRVDYIGRDDGSEPQPINIPGKVFVNRVLVPEVAIRLIQADLGVSRNQAIKTKKASDTYGFITFPDDDDEEGHYTLASAEITIKAEECSVIISGNSEDPIVIDD
ncbi:hypothetical protein JAAARDRAFT_710815 [Jaapia argillacea MUCL 33604]|uniref:Restriction of telomere capping protein 4 n=1 Tax=Jaapia argillacea MUCL 33604 TaxID=933084 RepID=A0A067P9G9_9AGAM|nr:hypothetical protein JAAARDRAFT_710815 [Jaapia argillacea MUCL 33604]